MAINSIFGISASGMSVEMTRVDVATRNIANSHATRGVDGKSYVPLKVVSTAIAAQNFQSQLAAFANGEIPGAAKIQEIVELNVAPRMVHEPGHPDADAQGNVAYPNVDLLTEMLTLTEASRVYEANVQAFNAAKSMAMRTLDIGGHK
ncbi:MAG: flagellar basal body rod protein FlgC [Gammaproteobacteria bacterium]|nr:flagellar basal body rod protein FlgC [Gammaproteobacteria bacterium]